MSVGIVGNGSGVAVVVDGTARVGMAIGSELLIEMGRSGDRVTSGKDIGISGGNGIGMKPPEDDLAWRGARRIELPG